MFYDIDINSAYTTVLAMLGLIAWGVSGDLPRRRAVPWPRRRLYAGRIRHSEHIRPPGVSVEGRQNLFFRSVVVLSATAAEIEAAQHIDPDMAIRVVPWVIYPWKDATVHPFEPFVTTIRDERERSTQRKPSTTEYIKLVGTAF